MNNLLPAKPAIYAVFYPLMRQVAYDHGYSLALHGSVQRDLDLIAFPWVERPKPYIDMIKAFGEEIGYQYDDNYIQANLSDKPLGRKAINLNIGGECWIDLSIMPIYSDSFERMAAEAWDANNAADKAVSVFKAALTREPDAGDVERIKAVILKGSCHGFSERHAEALAYDIAALSAMPKQDGWQTIDSAPKDGTEILVYSPERPEGKNISVVFWKDGRWSFFAHEQFSLFIDDTLTGWQPLPAPPKQLDKGGAG